MATKRREPGSLTNSQRFKAEKAAKQENSLGNKAKKAAKSVGDALTNKSQNVDPDKMEKYFGMPAKTTTTSTQATSYQPRNNSQSGSLGTSNTSSGGHEQALSAGMDIASQLGITEVEVSSLLGSDPYSADSSAPEMTAAEANTQKLRIQRQNNALEVRLEKVKQGRKVMAIAIENRRLIGDAVDYDTAGIEVATKVVKNETAGVKFNIEASKLRQTQEYLVQQEIATAGTIAMTPGIQREWEMKLEKQEIQLQGLEIEIEGAVSTNVLKRQELEARLSLIGEA